MVLSASSIESLQVFDSAYALVQRQGMFAAIGVIIMLVISRMQVSTIRKFAWAGLIVSVVLLFAVLVVGHSVAGQQNWIELFGPFRIQPSEFAKLGIILWTADTLARKENILDRWSHLLIPVAPVACLFVGLVVLEGDFGNALMLALIVAGMYFAVGAPLRLFAFMAGVGALGVAFLSVAAPYRIERFTSWLDQSGDTLGSGWQLTQGKFALGSGGLWGVGLGASKEKWGSLPEAHTDFIFPIIGEELGLVGTFTILILFAAMAFAAFRMTIRTQDMFIRVASAGVGTWIVVQAVTNLGGVLGVMPITGVPLPLVSYGGSSLVPCLIALGVLMAFARSEAGLIRPARRTAKPVARTRETVGS